MSEGLVARVLGRSDHGVIVAVPLPVAPALHADRPTLEAAIRVEERSLAASWGDRRLRTFVAGRVALRRALLEVGVEIAAPILKTPRGAPVLPTGVRASVSHKDELAIAMAARDDGSGAHLGVDVELLEERPVQRLDISRHVLTARELSQLSTLPEDDRHRALLTRFSLKESLYKALDPFVQRYVGFLEVEVRPHDDGTASFALALSHGEGPFVVDGAWRVVSDPLPCVITSVRVRRG